MCVCDLLARHWRYSTMPTPRSRAVEARVERAAPVGPVNRKRPPLGDQHTQLTDRPTPHVECMQSRVPTDVHSRSGRRSRLHSRGVVVNFDLGERFPRPRSQQRGSLRPRARRVAVLGVGAGGGRPLPLKGVRGCHPGIFFEIFDAKSRQEPGSGVLFTKKFCAL